MKNKFRSFLCLLLCAFLLPLVPGIQAEEADDFWYDPAEVFSGVVGKIAFAMPGLPTRMDDGDEEGLWLDSWQLYSHCARDGLEYQFHTADITPWIDSLMDNHYAFSRAEAAFQAMLDYCSFPVNSREGTISGLRKQWKDGFAYLTFDFVFPDDPGYEYSAKAVFDGTRVAAILGGKCAHTDRILSLLAPTTEEQLIAPRPQTVDFKGLSVTATDKASIVEDQGVSVLMCYTDDCTFLSGRFSEMDIPLNVLREPGSKAMALKVIAGQESEPIGCANIHDGVITSSDGFDLQYDFKADKDFGFTAVPYVGRLYITAKGLWCLLAEDNDTGRAFISSARILAESATPSDKPFSIIETLQDPKPTTSLSIIETLKDPKPAASISLPEDSVDSILSTQLDFDRAYNSVTPRENNSDPATLYQFVTALNDLYCTSALSLLNVSDSFFSNGSWVRFLYTDAIGMVAILSLSGSGEEVFVNDLRVLLLEGSSVDEKIYCNFAAMCARAATGDTSLFPVPESILIPDDIVTDSYTARYESQSEITGIVSRFIMDAIQPAAVTGATVGPRPGWNSTSGSFIPRAYAVTLDEFEQNWERINDFFYNGEFPLSWLGTGDEYGLDPSTMLLYVNYDTLLQVLTETVGDKVYVIQVFVSPVEDDLEHVNLCSSIAFAAAAGMNEGQYLGLLGGLSEYCTWETDITLWPMAAKGHVMLYLVEDPDGGPEDHLGCIVGFH